MSSQGCKNGSPSGATPSSAFISAADEYATAIGLALWVPLKWAMGTALIIAIGFVAVLLFITPPIIISFFLSQLWGPGPMKGITALLIVIICLSIEVSIYVQMAKVRKDRLARGHKWF